MNGNLLLVLCRFLGHMSSIYDLSRLGLGHQGREHSRRSRTLAFTGPCVPPCRKKSVDPTEIQTEKIICVALIIVSLHTNTSFDNLTP